MSKQDIDGRSRHRVLLPVVVAKVVLVVLVVVLLPSGLAVGLGVTHGIAVAAVLVVLGVVLLARRRGPARPDHTLAAEARIETVHASRYLVQLCQHAKKLTGRLAHLHSRASHERPEVLGVEWTDTTGTLTLSWGTCTLHAEQETLTVRVEAADEKHLRRVQDLITADLERFGRRDDLAVAWTTVT